MNPFNNNYFIGYVNHVSPQYVKVHFPSSILLNKNIYQGEEFNGGLIGCFVTIEGENTGFIGKISELDLPEKERLSLSDKAFQSSDFHPTAKVQILLSFDYFNSKVAKRTINTFPNIGAKVYVCPNQFIQQYVMDFGQNDNSQITRPLVALGRLTQNNQTVVKLSQQSLFSRHCAIVGTTGSGKSWTVAKLIEGIINNGTKAILLDPTGEYNNLCNGSNSVNLTFGINAYFPYQSLTIQDLFYLVKPASKIQMPKLMNAIQSLKFVKEGIGKEAWCSNNISEGCLKKEGLSKRNFEKYCYKHKEILNDNTLNFDLGNLERQIGYECVWDGQNSDKFGSRNENDLSNCVSLITRIGNIRMTGILKTMFGFGETCSGIENMQESITKFISMDNKQKLLLRIGFEEVGFESQAREIAANAIGTFLLGLARTKCLKKGPLILFVDEAHQFLHKEVVDEYFATTSLSAFDQIAKECRKYGLFLCLATQMPRDIPLGTLSQMGTFLVHRLISYNDKEAIKQACSSADYDMLSFLPVLGPGELILSGVDFPMPLSIKVDEPSVCPDSHTPQFVNVNEH